MQERRITERVPLLNAQGALATPGYATALLWDYKKDAIAASKWRLKEWDYYLINDDDYAVALTLADLGYAGLISASVLDFQNKSYQTSSSLAFFTFGKFNLPESSEYGVSEYQNKQVHFRFESKDGVRTIFARFSKFKDDEDLVIDVVLDNEPDDSMVIATPWAGKPKAFYYNQKIVGMRATGSFSQGELTHTFKPEDSFGLLDWGRGVWTYDNTWFWAAAQGWQDGKGTQEKVHRFGLNLGYGFGNNEDATENMAFLDGKMYKLGKLDFGIPPYEEGACEKLKGCGAPYNLMKPWHMHDEEGKLDLIFTPTIDRSDYMNFGVIITDQHQVFGTYSGTVMLDDREFVVKDLKGFAEVVHNKY